MKASRPILKVVALACVGFSGLACQSYPFTFQTNQRVDARNYQSQITATGKTDVLFVLDNTPSMLGSEENVKTNTAAFIDTLSQSIVDYQVGIVAADMARVPANDGTCTPCCDIDLDGDGIPDFSDCDGGRLIASDGKSIHRVIKRPSPDLSGDALVAANADVVKEFTDNISAAGTSGNPFRRAFEATKAALSPSSDFAIRALNSGFLRPDADLAVIFMSDEEECSHDDTSWFSAFGRDNSECYTDPTATPVGEVIDFLASLKGGDIRRIRGAAIVGAVADPSVPLKASAAGCYTAPDGTASNDCGCFALRYVPDRSTPDPSDDLFCNLLAASPYDQPNQRIPALPGNQGGCERLPGARYVALLNELYNRRLAAGQTEGVLLDSLCKADYKQTLVNIANSVIANNCFNLQEPPSDYDPNINPVDDPTGIGETEIQVLRNGAVLPHVPYPSKDQQGWGFHADPANNVYQICLQGGLTLNVNDTYEIDVITRTKGFDAADGGPTP